ncbi:MAG: helix-turn-helix transcriptional regulator [Acidimicrobiaceae bacterium]|nr:helix-turn-helix transcriptional regulator [Ilumatobacter sp.]MCB9380870.1 helix-turn-helix transcriptional regulator [Acidimicrobiaceae bacterium]MCO5329851.1 helix-turn-helix transcriptional regulator [Ilumatobacteraceae bacterium]
MENSLRVRRAANGWSQAHLADLLGVSRQTVNALETGRYDPSLPLAFRLARVFATTIEDLFTPTDSDLRSPA